MIDIFFYRKSQVDKLMTNALEVALSEGVNIAIITRKVSFCTAVSFGASYQEQVMKFCSFES